MLGRVAGSTQAVAATQDVPASPVVHSQVEISRAKQVLDNLSDVQSIRPKVKVYVI